MNVQSYRDGKLIDNESLSERAFIYSDGVFETMRCRRKTLPLWSFHKRRLQKAQRQLHLSIDFAELEAQLEGILQNIEDDDAIIKLIVGRTGEARGSYNPEKASAVFYFSIRPLIQKTRRDTVRLKKVDKVLRDFGAISGLKLINRLDYIVASAEMHFEPDEEALFLDQRGHIVETMHHNIFAVIDSKLVTPDLSRCGVAGTMRECMISSIAKKCGIDAVEAEISFPQLLKSEAVFLTNAVDGVIQVSEIEGFTLPDSSLITDLQSAAGDLFA